MLCKRDERIKIPFNLSSEHLFQCINSTKYASQFGTLPLFFSLRCNPYASINGWRKSRVPIWLHANLKAYWYTHAHTREWKASVLHCDDDVMFVPSLILLADAHDVNLRYYLVGVAVASRRLRRPANAIFLHCALSIPPADRSLLFHWAQCSGSLVETCTSFFYCISPVPWLLFLLTNSVENTGVHWYILWSRCTPI